MLTKPSEIYTKYLGLRDYVASGCFNHDTGELRPGFAIVPEDVVLDVGCGDGIDCHFCGERGAHVIYADRDPAKIELAGRLIAGSGARALTPIVTDANPLPLADGAVSKVIASEVIEHVDDPAEFLKELMRVGRPGAQYLLSVPDPASEELQKGLAVGAYFEKPNHIRIIGREEFARLVTDAGLIIEHRGFYGFYWTIWWLLFWISKSDLDGPPPPLLESWSTTWRILLDMPESGPVRQALNEILPKSQYIVARKPGGPRDTGRSDQGLRGAWQSIRRFIRPPALAPTLPIIVPPAVSPPAVTSSTIDPIDSQIVGLHDAVESGWFRTESRELFEGFSIGPDDVVLDVGCGGGNYSEICAKWGAHVIFTDIDAGNVAATEKRLAAIPARGMTPIVGDADPLPLDDESVSRIISTEVIEHVDDPPRFLAELARVGKPGALYLLAVPDEVQEAVQRKLAPPSFFVKPRPGEGTIRGLSSGHLRTIGREEFEKMVSNAGLILDRHRYAGFYWALWFALFWICEVDFSAPRHPLLASWARTWKLVLDMPDGHRVKDPLDAFMPKSQIIVARKPWALESREHAPAKTMSRDDAQR